MEIVSVVDTAFGSPRLDWPKIHSDHTRTSAWGTRAVGQSIWLATSCAELSPVMVAEQFLPPGKLEIVSVMGTALGSPQLDWPKILRDLTRHSV